MFCIKPTMNNGWHLYDLGQITSAYVLDMPKVGIWVEGTTHVGRVMSISREGGRGFHIIKMLVEGQTGLRELCLRTAVI